MSESFFKPGGGNEDSKVVDIKTGEPYKTEVESVEGDLDAVLVNKKFNALMAVVTSAGIRLNEGLGFNDLKKINKLPQQERVKLQTQFIKKVFDNPETYLILFFNKTYREGVKGDLKKLREGNFTKEVFEISIKAWDKVLRSYAPSLSDDDIVLLQDMFGI